MKTASISGSHREILQITLPSILSNITVPLLSLVDLTIVGHLGSAVYIGAIAIGGTMFNMIYWIFAFLRMGTTGITSQAYGSHRTEAEVSTLYRSLTIALLLGLLLLLFQSQILRLALWIMEPTANVGKYASLYFSICIWGAPAMLAQYGFTGWFLGMQEARYPLYIALFQNIVNILCSLFFVFVSQLGVGGVALGTLIAQYAGLFLALGLCRNLFRRKHLSGRCSLRMLSDRAALLQFFRVNRDIFLRTLCLVAVTLYFTSSGSRQGDLILAVNVLLMQFFTLYSYFMDGLAFAAEALSGKYYGAGNTQRFHTTIRHLFLWGSAIAVLFTLIYIGGGEHFLSLLTNEPDVLSAARPYHFWTYLIPTAGLCAFVWDGVFIGITATRQMLISMFFAAVLFFTVYFSFEANWHNHALWAAFLVYLFSRGMIQTVLYRGMIKRKMTANSCNDSL